MKSGDLSARRRLLARQNYGRKEMSAYLGGLSLALSENLSSKDLLPLEETDRFYEHFVESYKLAVEGKVIAYQRKWPLKEKDILEQKLQCFSENIASNEVVLFPKGFDYCGALKTNLHMVLKCIFELLHFDKDSVSLLDQSKANGFMLDCYEDYIKEHDGITFEVVIWGDNWAGTIGRC